MAVRRALYLDVGRRIREARQAAGISRANLAYDVGVAEKTIVRMERGHFGPDLYLVGLIAKLCKVPLPSLLPFELPALEPPKEED